jgi:hypothetical protein
MAKGRFAQIVLLAEDDEQAGFIRRWLLGWIKHLDRRDIHEVVRPSGKGAGEQFVRKQFPAEAASIEESCGIEARSSLP